MSQKAPGILVALLGGDSDVTLQLRWAIALARMRKLDLVVLQRVESSETSTIDVALEDTVKMEGAGATHALRRLVEEHPDLRAGAREARESGPEDAAIEESVTHVEFRLIHFDSLRSLRRSVVAELSKARVVLFTIARKQLIDRSQADLNRERRLLLRHVACEMVLCHGLQEDFSFSRVLVATAPGPNGQAALKLGLDLAHSANGTMTALHVNPDVGGVAEQVGERRLTRLLDKALGPESAAVQHRVVVDDQAHRGVRRVLDERHQDLVVVGAPRAQIEGSLGTRLGKGVPVVFVSAASPVRSRLRKLLEESVSGLVPQIERDDRIGLVDRLQSNAAWNFDFLALMVLSTVIAAIGLIQNSGAVVIGAMLVAPLMTPLLGLGLSVVQGNPVLARLTLRSIAYGLGVSMLGGFLVGLVATGFEEPTREMLGRGGPGMLDLFVAFAAGLAAAYASSRPSLIAALPGVAIAAALVPPIATSGLALSLGDFSLAIGALLLFGINMVTIVLSAMVSLWAVGFRSLKKSSGTAIAAGAIVVMVLGLGIHLALRPAELELTAELPPGLLEAVNERLPENYRLEDVAVAYDEIGVQLNVGVLGREPAPEEVANEIRQLASDHYHQPVRVRLLTRIAIEVDGAEIEAIEVDTPDRDPSGAESAEAESTQPTRATRSR